MSADPAMQRRWQLAAVGVAVVVAAVVAPTLLTRNEPAVRADASVLPWSPQHRTTTANGASGTSTPTTTPSGGAVPDRPADNTARLTTPASPALPAWHRIRADEPVALLIERAVASPNLDDRASIPYLLTGCFSVPADVPDDPLALRMMALWSNRDGPALAPIVDQAIAARRRLRLVCDTPALNRLMDSERVRDALVSAQASPVRRLMVGESQRDPERYGQAVQQVLANPQAHPLALDLWLQQQLRHNLPPAVFDDPAQRHHVHARLLDHLAGPAIDDSLRALVRCAGSFICPASSALPPAQRAAADAAAAQLETRIREQRWSDLHWH